jgi:hypothetical protein
MAQLEVTAVTVPVLLERLRRREWVVPRFQRDFVWTVADIVKLVASILDSRPIGMATLWEQNSQVSAMVESEAVWIPDSDAHRTLPGPEGLPSKRLAILDGRQRCTAIAIAFGGLKAQDGKSKFAGRFYLDVASADPNERVVYKKENEIQKQHLDTDASCIGRGFFPLSSSLPNEDILPQWMRYLQALKNPDNYPGGSLPPSDELERRDQILKYAFEGIVNTKLAVYIVPESYGLAAICEIFETLNQTGQVVSTVDLIHSWLYADTQGDLEGPILLRDWIREFGQMDGAIGWSYAEDRPELIAQFVTACYVAQKSKPAPRSVSGTGTASINSVKAADLLATPTQHWRSIVRNSELLARFIGDFQQVVAGGVFPFWCAPYPVSGAVYVALRWHLHFDKPTAWGREDLDSLYRAFFWRNALTSRYDQGFLTQLGTDIKELTAILELRSNFASPNAWANEARVALETLIRGFLPTKEQLVDLLTDGRQAGALQKTLTLPMLAGIHKDLLDPQTLICFAGGEPPELHHIFPRAWCATNKTGRLASLLDKTLAGRNWVESIANQMPLSRKSNNIWKAKVPDQILAEQEARFPAVRNAAESVFIDAGAFEFLRNGSKDIEAFWSRRADLIAIDLLGRTNVTL